MGSEFLRSEKVSGQQDGENKPCPTCGSTDYEVKEVEYIYRHKGRYLLVRGVPAEVCRGCGTRFYRAEVLHEIERCFFTMEDEQAVDYVKMPVTAYAAMCPA